jgi:hypothetical protein
MKRFYFFILIGILITACQSNTESQSNTANQSNQEIAPSEQSIAYKLAVLEKDDYVSEDDQIVVIFDDLLQQLDNKYNVTKQEIGDMTYKLKEITGNEGINVSMIKVMEGALQVVNLTYAEYLGNYLTLREQGYTHNNTIESLKLL